MAEWRTVRFDPTYPEPLDPEIVPLCDVLNAAAFPTTCSCCGHGIDWPKVWFEHTTDERTEALARFVERREGGDLRPHFTVWEKEILIDGYLWHLEVHVNEVYKDTPPAEFLRRSVLAIEDTCAAIRAWAEGS